MDLLQSQRWKIWVSFDSEKKVFLAVSFFEIIKKNVFFFSKNCQYIKY